MYAYVCTRTHAAFKSIKQHNLLQYDSLSNPTLCFIVSLHVVKKVRAAHDLNVETSPAGTLSAELLSVPDFCLTKCLCSAPVGPLYQNCS